jgi:hypothetical protein
MLSEEAKQGPPSASNSLSNKATFVTPTSQIIGNFETNNNSSFEGDTDSFTNFKLTTISFN